ncbi:MAG: indole-3-glycerol-phosphate synthase, partial [Nitrospinota bacterium]
MKKGNLLGNLLEGVREELEERRARVPLSELKARLRDAPPPRDFLGALRARPTPGASLHVIAELKKASPSLGLIASRYDPVGRALLYEEGGASAISVLTERRAFRGELGHLTRVRERVSLPLLQKDFTVEPYQVYEGRLFGADAVLFIAAILDERELGELLALSRELGMEALLEVHDEEELSLALATSARLIGINNRDLNT